MKNFTHYFGIVVLFAVSVNLNAQDFFPEMYKLEEQPYILKEIETPEDPYASKMELMDEILFSEDFGDSLLGNGENGLWDRNGQHGLIWKYDFNGPDGPLIENAPPLLSTTGLNGFMIFDADAADPINTLGEKIGFLESATMDLSLPNSAILQFQQFFNYCCYNFSPLFVGVSNDNGVTWTDLDAIEGYSDGANNFSENPMVSNIDISPYVAGYSEVKIRFGFNPEDYEGFTHYFWAVDDILIFVNPIEFDLAVRDMFLTDITADYEYLQLPEAQANNQIVSVIVSNNGGQDLTGVYVALNITDPSNESHVFSSDTISLDPGVRATLLIQTDFSPEELGLYNCSVNAISNEENNDEIPANNSMEKAFITNPNIMAHETGMLLEGSAGSRYADNGIDFKEFALGSMFKMQASAVLDGLQAQVVDSSAAGKTVYPVIYRVVSGGIQGEVVPVEGYSVDALLDGYTLSDDDVSGAMFNIGLSTTVTLDPDEYYMICLYSEENGDPVYFKTIEDGDSDYSTIRFGLDQFGDENWFNAYDFTPAIRLNFNISLAVNEVNQYVSDVTLYPNPASENITLTFLTKGNESVGFKVYDMTGKMVFNRNLGNLPYGEQQLNLNLDGLNSGMYFYELQQGNSIVSNKFIVK